LMKNTGKYIKKMFFFLFSFPLCCSFVYSCLFPICARCLYVGFFLCMFFQFVPLSCLFYIPFSSIFFRAGFS
jgi:hypothetical protein